MFEPNSRYYSLETATYSAPDGQRRYRPPGGSSPPVIAYKRRRFLPHGEDLPLLVEVTVAQSDRLDLITYRTLGDPEAFWRVADANNAMNPTELEQPGVTLRIPIPGA
jgi:hypothetical protein